MNESAIALAHSLTTDPFPPSQLDYAVCHTNKEMVDYICRVSDAERGCDPILVAEDTESLPDGSPYCLTFSMWPGTGRLIYANNKSLLENYAAFLEGSRPHQIFHNYLHDVTMFDALGLPIYKFTDTMVRAYNLCLGGGGDDDEDASGAARGLLSLKVLAWRHCQMRMTSFQDTVHPHSIPHALAWLKQGREMLAPMPVKTCECGHARERHLPRGKTGKTAGACTLCQCLKYKQYKKPKGVDDGSKELGLLHRKINGLVNQLENGEPDINPWKRVGDWHDFDRETLENALGPMPRPSIAHVPEPELLQYAVRDCDATLRLYLHMRRLKPWIFYNR